MSRVPSVFNSLVRSRATVLVVVSSRLLLTLFPGREARTHSCTSFFIVVLLLYWGLWLIWGSECLKCVWCVVLVWWVRLLQENSGETCYSRPSEPVSPRWDDRDSPRTIFARKVAQATSSTFERASTSPRREGSRLSEIPCVLLSLFRALT